MPHQHHYLRSIVMICSILNDETLLKLLLLELYTKLTTNNHSKFSLYVDKQVGVVILLYYCVGG